MQTLFLNSHKDFAFLVSLGWLFHIIGPLYFAALEVLDQFQNFLNDNIYYRQIVMTKLLKFRANCLFQLTLSRDGSVVSSALDVWLSTNSLITGGGFFVLRLNDFCIMLFPYSRNLNVSPLSSLPI